MHDVEIVILLSPVDRIQILYTTVAQVRNNVTAINIYWKNNRIHDPMKSEYAALGYCTYFIKPPTS